MNESRHALLIANKANDISSKKTVLVVEPGTNTRLLLDLQLQREGYRVFTAASGIEALDLVANEIMPELVIMEVIIPFMDGFTVAKRLLAMGPIKIIFLSELSDTETKVFAINQYAEDYVTKPFVFSELLARMRRILLGKVTHFSDEFALDVHMEDKKKSKFNDVSSISSDEATLLLGSLVHRMSNLLAAVPDILALAKESDAVDKYVDISIQSVQNALNVLRRLQAVSTPLSLESINVPILLKIVAEQINIPDSIDLELQLAESRSSIIGNQQILSEVLINIIDNSVQAMPEGGILKVSYRTVECNEVVEIRITDGGIGIDEKFVDKIFEPFFTTRKEDGGQGIGLWISLKLLQKFGGSLILEQNSIKDKETTFLIRLPVQEIHESDA